MRTNPSSLKIEWQIYNTAFTHFYTSVTNIIFFLEIFSLFSQKILMSKIIFTESGHEYRRIDNVLYLSVSEFKNRFKRPYDDNHNARKKAFQDVLGDRRYKSMKDRWEAQGGNILQPEYLQHLFTALLPAEIELYEGKVNLTKKQWKAKNKKSITKGNLYHAAQERKALEAGFMVNHHDGLEYPVYMRSREDGNESLDSDLWNLPDGFYPELLISYDFPTPVYDPVRRELVGGIAGQADKTFLGSYSLTERFSDELDLKTNEKINTFGFKVMNLYAAGEYGYERYLPPIDRYVVCTMQDYYWQLNFYAWMLAQVGYESRNRTIQHLNQNIAVPQLFHEIELLIQHYLDSCELR